MWSEKELVVFYGVITAVLLIFIIGILVFLTQFRKRKIEYQQEMDNLKTSFEKEKIQVELDSHKYAMKEIGKEIHDGVGQKLTLASIYLKSQEELHQDLALKEVSNLIDDSLQELRNLSRSLINPEKYAETLQELILEENKKVEELHGIHVKFHQTGFQKIPVHYRNHIRRIVQEFLQNSVKYAYCTEITITLIYTQDMLNVICKDNGKGLEISKAMEKGVGLSNIIHRINEMKGTHQLISKKDRGVELKFVVPYPENY